MLAAVCLASNDSMYASHVRTSMESWVRSQKESLIGNPPPDPKPLFLWMPATGEVKAIVLVDQSAYQLPPERMHHQQGITFSEHLEQSVAHVVTTLAPIHIHRKYAVEHRLSSPTCNSSRCGRRRNTGWVICVVEGPGLCR